MGVLNVRKNDLRVINCTKQKEKTTQIEKFMAVVTSNQELVKKRKELEEKKYNQKYTQLSLFTEES